MGPVSPILDQAIERIDETIVELRRLIADLRPAALDELGVEAALASLVERHSSTGVEVDLFVDLGQDEARARYEPLLEDTVYRLVQESLNNAVRHGHARRAIVEVVEEAGKIRIRVADDGSGFDPKTAGGGGFGLLGMRERVNLTGGRFDVRSGEDGTTITATLPVLRP